MTETHTGGCNCGALRFTAEGPPKRTGLCHCQTCRRQSGSAFSAFTVWPRHRVTITGPVAVWSTGPEQRHFCPTCGSPVFALGDDASEIEIRLGTLDAAPSGFMPSYELWIHRREAWQAPLPEARQLPFNRDS